MISAFRARHIGSAFVLALLLAATVPLAFQRHSPADSNQPFAGFCGLLFDFAFDRSVVTGGITRAFVYAAQGYRFDTLQDVNSFNIMSAHAIRGSAQRIMLKDAPMESPYWWDIQSREGAMAFLRALSLWIPEESGRSSCGAPALDVLRKALLQRDLFQIYSMVFMAKERAEDPRSREMAERLEEAIAMQIGAALLSEREYEVLVASIPGKVPMQFTPVRTASSDYLPSGVVVRDESWLEIQQLGKPFRHFIDYRGRGFVKVFVRSPQLTPAQLKELWSRLYDKHGRDLHTSAVQEETPAGLETMLVRTIGVFMDDGTYRDSFWPEEVIIRIFKYSGEKLDLGSSDFRGTDFYQYKLSRAAALKDPGSLGLKRVHDDDQQFFGFFGDVADPNNAYSNTVTTMRSNCIGCHAELFYGLSTIFSFERNPRPAPTANLAEGMLRAEGRGFRLLTREAQSLEEKLRLSSTAEDSVPRHHEAMRSSQGKYP